MSHKKIVQLPCDAELYDKICSYKEAKKHRTDAGAIRELLVFALKVMEQSGQDQTVSTRALLEKMFYLVAQSNQLSQHVFYNTFVDYSLEENRANAQGIASRANKVKGQCSLNSKQFCHDFLSGKIEE